MKSITGYWQTINPVSILLFPISLVFCFLVILRRQLYRIGLLSSYKASIPIIVVGNIYIGGNGKTPFVIWLVNQLKLSGYKPAIVSRGYGALNEQSAKIPFPRLVNLQQNHQLFSDEPLLIYKSTECPVIIDPIRIRAVKKIEQSLDCDIIVSDDGLQHYAMLRDIEINISDAKRLYGNSFCLPAGPLREHRQRLKSIDYHVFNISQIDAGKNTQQYADNEYSMNYELHSLCPLCRNESNNSLSTLEDFKGKIVHAVAGIGEPKNFFELLKTYGLSIIEHPFDDHYQYQKDDLNFVETYPIIMTEKDAVKCQSVFAEESLENCWFLPIEAKIDDNLLNSIISQLKSLKH